MDVSVKEFHGAVVVKSTDVAKSFGKRHDHVLRDIDAMLREAQAHSPGMGSELFTESTFVNKRNRSYREFLMTRDGFALLAMGFTGEKAFRWKLKYVSAFNQMEKVIAANGRGAMQALSEAVAALESDMAKASQYGKALSEWKKIKDQHIKDIIEANSRAQMVIDFALE